MKNCSCIQEIFTVVIFLISSELFSQTFTEQGITLPGIDNGNAIWGDADNDGDIDILVAGLDAGNSHIVKLYRNNGSNAFSDAGLVFSPAIPTVSGQNITSAQWVDFDCDGFLDIILNAPTNSETNNLLIYRHETDHSYLLKTTIDYWTWQGNSIDCGDYDNDGDQDIMLVTNNSTKIFQNQGSFVFREQTSIVLDGLARGSCRFADYDNDGDLDIVMTGFKQLYRSSNRVYRNNGYNNFTLQTGTNLAGYYGGSIESGDYNNDGKLDLLLTGEGGNPGIYKNNGNNTFSIYYISSLYSLADGTAKWGDLDNDGDLDIVVSGSNSGSNITKVYFNNGNNVFAEQTGIIIDGVFKSSIDLYDYDKDNDLDILITGNNGLSKICKVFKNTSTSINAVPQAPTGLSVTPNGNDIVLKWNSVRTDNTSYNGLSYNVMIGTSSGGINILSPASGSDGFHRISGMGNSQLDTTYIIRNLPLSSTYYWKVQAIDNSAKGGSFASGPNFAYTTQIQAYGLSVPVRDGNTATFTWSRGNGSACAVFLKEANTGTALPANNTIYTGSAVFKSGTQIGTSGWYCVYNGTLTTVNVKNLKANTDYIFDVIEYTAGPTYNISSVSGNPLVFKTGTFTEITAANLLPVSTLNYTRNTNILWFDIDNDPTNDLDLLIVGPSFTRLYRNDGSNTFTLLSSPFGSGYSASCGDYDNDGLIDVVISASLAIRLYKNTGSGNFVEQAGAIPLYGDDGAVDWGDYDNDGDLDLIITLSTSTDGRISRVYKNNGGGSFTDQQSILLEGLAYGAAKWVDYDNDGYLDITITGGTNDAGYATKIYRNNGKNNFSELTGMNFTGLTNGSVDWGDYDNDGDPDMIITGFNFFTSTTALYRNDGTNGFLLQSSNVEGAPDYLPGVNFGSAKFGDYDNDGDLDILITGFRDFYNSQIAKIFKNNGDGTFAEDISSVLPGVGGGSASWGDYDKDGDLDIVLGGNTPDAAIAKIYRNDLNIINSSPAVPTSLTSTVNLSDVTLKWKSVRGDNTPYKAMTYNLKVGTASGGINIIAPNSASTGLRRIVAIGNAGLDTTFTFRKMPFGTYYWRVQAVDNGFAGGPFSSEGNFTVSPTQARDLSAKIIDNNSLLLKWNRGNGDRCVVFCKQTSTGLSVPVNNESYVADPEYGFGGQIGTSGWYCIYNGRDDSVIVKGLIYNKLYSFHIIEYMGNAGGEQYFTQVVDGNPGVFSTSLFTDQSGITLNSGLFNNVEWGDYDNDGFIDLLVPGIPTTRIYRNKGDNTFEEKTGIILPAVNYGSAKWGDYDQDGDLDIVITGATTSDPVSNPLTKIYRNDRLDVFTEQTNISLTPLLYSSVAWETLIMTEILIF